jgi:septal ring factor EnvC (AmiA/AmiB activator)
MTTSNEQVTKLPLVKRVILALRGGVGEGLSAVVVLLAVVLVVVLALGAFMGGMMVGASHTRGLQQKMVADLRQARTDLTKAKADLAEAEKKIADNEAQAIAQQNDVKILKDQVQQAKLEHDAMEKVLADIRDGLQASDAKDDSKLKKVAKVVDSAKVKFGNSECNLANGTVNSKQDVKCLDLRNAIDTMNAAPGGYEDKKAKPAAGSAGK